MMQDVKKFVQPLEENELLDGILIEDVAFAGAVTVDINHKLGRQPRGWILTDFTALAGTGVVRSAWDDKTISLDSSAACDLSLWVF
ncbi:MAG: hypothetical protein JRE40_07615 [Deltaproteobacteria bacterium]|nr:hypothetical protein [Deltaproteobacteria bacterium]